MGQRPRRSFEHILQKPMATHSNLQRPTAVHNNPQRPTEVPGGPQRPIVFLATHFQACVAPPMPASTCGEGCASPPGLDDGLKLDTERRVASV